MSFWLPRFPAIGLRRSTKAALINALGGSAVTGRVYCLIVALPEGQQNGIAGGVEVIFTYIHQRADPDSSEWELPSTEPLDGPSVPLGEVLLADVTSDDALEATTLEWGPHTRLSTSPVTEAPEATPYRLVATTAMQDFRPERWISRADLARAMVIGGIPLELCRFVLDQVV